MRKYLLLAVSASVLLLVAGCNSQQPQQQASAQPQADFRPTATVKDIMDALVDPGSDYIWDSVETVVSAKGTEEKAPHTDEEWKQVRNHAIMLLEATNLLRCLAVTWPWRVKKPMIRKSNSDPSKSKS